MRVISIKNKSRVIKVTFESANAWQRIVKKKNAFTYHSDLGIYSCTCDRL